MFLNILKLNQDNENISGIVMRDSILSYLQTDILNKQTRSPCNQKNLILNKCKICEWMMGTCDKGILVCT